MTAPYQPQLFRGALRGLVWREPAGTGKREPAGRPSSIQLPYSWCQVQPLKAWMSCSEPLKDSIASGPRRLRNTLLSREETTKNKRKAEILEKKGEPKTTGGRGLMSVPFLSRENMSRCPLFVLPTLEASARTLFEGRSNLEAQPKPGLPSV